MRTLLIVIVGLLGAAGASAQVECVEFSTGGPVQRDCVFNNGLAPPSPDNVIDDDTTYSNDWVHVRNVGCPPTWPEGTAFGPCPSPGGATELEVGVDGEVQWLWVYDSSIVTMDGAVTDDSMDALVAGDSSTVTIGGSVSGRLTAEDSASVTIDGTGFVSGLLLAADSSTVTIASGQFTGAQQELRATDSANVTIDSGFVNVLVAYGSAAATINGGKVVNGASTNDSSTIAMTGGVVSRELVANDTSTMEIRGGILDEFGPPSGGRIVARGESTITIDGTDFLVNTGSGPAPVPYGPLAAQTGRITGTLASGEPMDDAFFQGGATDDPCSVADPCSGTITLPEPGHVSLTAWALMTLVLLRRRAGRSIASSWSRIGQ